MFPRCASSYCMKTPRWGSDYCSERCLRDEALRQARESGRRIRAMLVKATREARIKKETPTP